jgi:alanyl-tRNA synthetase
MDSYSKIRSDFKSFWTSRGHVEVPAASLVPRDDATTLFTSSGMQQLVPYLSGEQEHPLGKNLYNIQPCLRAGDIDEVGDNSHTTFFEMLGNWSLGDYFKLEQIPAMWELYTKVFGLNANNLHVTVFEGNDIVPKDTESQTIWKKLGIPEDHIHWYGVEKNWWSRSGVPSQMPEGEIGGPDTELFYEFKDIDHNPAFGPKCHPNCDCGRFMEIGNSVFIQYRKGADGSLQELDQKSVDFGGGLERILAAQLDDPVVFNTILFSKPKEILKSIISTEHERDTRIILDHLRASLFLVRDGVFPANKEQGYVLRKLLRRALLSLRKYDDKVIDYTDLLDAFALLYKAHYAMDIESIKVIFTQEMSRFYKLLTQTSTLLHNKHLSAELLFDMYQSHGIPLEISLEEAVRQGMSIPQEISPEFEKLVELHSKSAKAASEGKFKGGLADASNQVIKYHTATHLIHQSLHDILGDSVRQEGSNITQERLRFDFHVDTPMVADIKEQVQNVVNEKIRAQLPVHTHTMPREAAIGLGARSFFREKYPDIVTVYAIGGTAADPAGAYSLELCGGPHVTNTSEIGTIIVDKIQKIGASIYRLYAHSDETKETSKQ